MSQGSDARRVARRFQAGVLATNSARLPGYPYTSALPFCTDPQGRIVVLVSHLAEHTRNAEADPRASFMVSPLGADLQEQARVSLMGDLAVVEDGRVAARYLRFFPDAQRYLEIGGFRHFRLEPRSVRFIAGFGSIHTVAGESYLAGEHPLAEAEEGILGHMNQDHPHNLVDYCRHVHGVEPREAAMIGIDCDGFDVRADGRLLRFDFKSEVRDAVEARAVLVALAKASRA